MGNIKLIVDFDREFYELVRGNEQCSLSLQAIADGKPYKEKAPEIPKGNWSEPFEVNDKLFHKCSQCHISTQVILITNFCPNCGADMRQGDKV